MDATPPTPTPTPADALLARMKRPARGALRGTPPPKKPTQGLLYSRSIDPAKESRPKSPPSA